MKAIQTMLVMAVAATIMISCDEEDKVITTSKDRNFLNNVAYANAAEIQFGETASGKAMDTGVKEFGSDMVSDHTTITNELKDLAGKKQVSIVNEPDDEHKAKHTLLMTYSGYQFDTAYVNSQVKDHELAVTLFQRAKDDGDDADVKAFASKHLPHIQEHLATALSLKQHLDANPPAGRTAN